MTAVERVTLDDFNSIPSGLLVGELRSQNGAGPNHSESVTAAPRFAGLTYAEARCAVIPATNELVAGLVDAGTVGLIAGLPFARKSWAALELAHKVAAGRGDVFGRFNVVKGGPVLYVWQDDSLPKELERLQAYAGRHHYSDELPLRFLLNEGVQLPDDIDALAALMEDDGSVLLIVDSLYNALGPSVKLKEEEVAIVLARIKAGICDRTGATAGLVDHAPWPTEGNRGQRRAYGSVFKTAAVRWSIHLEADARDDTRLHVEASGNNVAGFRRTPAIWNAEALEIRLLEVERLDEDTLDELVLAWVNEHPGTATTKVAGGVGKRRENVAESLERLGRLERVTSKPSRELGRPGTGTYWFPFNHEGFEPSRFDGTTRDGSGSNSFTEGEPSQPSHPRRGTAHRTSQSNRAICHGDDGRSRRARPRRRSRQRISENDARELAHAGRDLNTLERSLQRDFDSLGVSPRAAAELGISLSKLAAAGVDEGAPFNWNALSTKERAELDRLLAKGRADG